MNDVETRLRDALSARADAVAHDPAAYAAVVRRRERRTGNRLRAVAATTATVAAVVAVVAVARPAAEPPPAAPATASPAPAPPAAPAPTAWIGVVSEHAQLWMRGFDGSKNRTTLDGTRVTAVAALGDSKRFVFAARDERRCSTDLARWDITRNEPARSGTALRDVKGPDVAGEVTALAVSPDGRRLAYLMRPADRRSGRCADVVMELRVRDLATGREQAWREPAPPAPDSPFEVVDVPSMSWSPDGRYVSPGAAFRIVDTTAADGALIRSTDPGVFIGDQLCMLQDRTFRGRTGEVVGYLFCPGSPHTGVHVLDGDRPVRLLIPAPSDSHYAGGEVQFDRSGDHAFLLLGEGLGAETLYRWDSDKGLNPVDTGDDEIDGIDW